MRARPFHSASLAALSGATLLVVALTPAGCPREVPTAPEAPLRRSGVPVIRVLVAREKVMRVSTTGPYRILADGREVAGAMDPLPEAALTYRAGVWQLQAASFRAERLTIAARLQTRRVAAGGLDVGRSCVRVGSTSYRGRIVFLPGRDGDILAVNHVDVESYLAGVLGRELYAGWHERTYEALAIAARTFALYEKAVADPRRPYDIRDDQSAQVYGGFSAETQKSWRAVRATHGVVLAAGPDGDEKIFRAHYSACCGGVTNSVYVLYGPPVTTGPLSGGQVCRDCRACPRYRWPAVTVPKDVIHRAVSKAYPAARLEGVRTVEVVESMGSRPVWVRIVGTKGRSIRIRAEDLRLALLRDGDASARGLYSMNCRIRDAGEAIVFEEGRGFGHGVGLCQWGAEAKAEAGMTVSQILSAYYPGAKLFEAY